MRLRLAGALAVLALASASLSGCGVVPFVTVTGCPSWAAYDDPAAAAAEADAVVIGRVVEEAGSGSFMGAGVSTWRVEVDEWVKGGEGETEIVVTPAIDTCGPPAPDPLGEVEGEGAVGLFLSHDGGWAMMSPVFGLVELDATGSIPAEWPADHLG